ncbi:hypothetical protein GJAV_G00013570 [Gymnothorax javanicus]|nr:hypothetical protein GJAV_G00013570 [Gymnothorax javanicus]
MEQYRGQLELDSSVWSPSHSLGILLPDGTKNTILMRAGALPWRIAVARPSSQQEINMFGCMKPKVVGLI